MSNDPARLSPTPIAPRLADDPAPRAPRNPLTAHRGGLRWLLVSVLLAAAASLLLPGLMAPAPKAIPPAGADAAASKPAEPPDPILSPEAKAAARLEAQQGLAKVLTTMDQLSARQPQSWDAAGWAAAQTQLADGERAYREERYPAAIRLYRETGRQLATLEAALPGLIASRLRAAQHAFDTGNAPAAVAGFKQVLAVDPDSTEARTGLQRAGTYDQVQALLGEAAGYERMEDPAKARAAFEAALALGPATTAASEGLARLTESDSAEAYENAMSTGYAALAEGRFDEAKVSFARALKLNPTETARGALAQSVERGTAAKIAAALALAERSEAAERWADAARAYSSALALDKGLGDLSPKLERARSRAALQQRLAEAIKAAGSGADLDSAAAVLEDARRIPNPGPRHRAQMKQLTAAIAAAKAKQNEP